MKTLIKLKVGDLILLVDTENPAGKKFPHQRAEVLEADYKNQVLTFCILKEDRQEGDEDGIGEGGFEDVYLLKPVTK